MTDPLLSIIIPTYNRAGSLEMLLRALRSELVGLEGQVTVIVGDNASPDRTAELTTEFARHWPDTVVLRHATNVGPEENFCRCVEQATGRYFWIMGDDDLPGSGVVRALKPVLEAHTPDLVYLSSSWRQTLNGNGQAEPIRSLDAQTLDRYSFACRVHVWTTFISGNVVRRGVIQGSDLRRFSGTHLVQLGWVLGALKNGSRFLHVSTPSVLATSGNTGGYAVLKVFGNNFQCIVREVFSGDRQSRRIAAAIITRTSIGFLPGLVWGFRQATLGAFDSRESVATALGPQLGRSAAYRLLIQPLEYAPTHVARVLLRGSRALSRLLGLYDLARAKAVGGVKKP